MAKYNNSNDDSRTSHSCYSNVEDSLNSLRMSLSEVSALCDPQLKSDFEEKLDEAHNWVIEQKTDSEEDPKQMMLDKDDAAKVLLAVAIDMLKLKSEDPHEISIGVLNIISTLGPLAGKPYCTIIPPLCAFIRQVLTDSKPQQPSLVDQLAQVVHKELYNFNRKLQDQKYDGLKDRVSDQISQLRMMKPGEKLDDPDLWNDYVQFMGELSKRFESPLPFTYEEESLTKDPDVNDFVTALVTYCRAYSCFMALLLAARGTFENLGRDCKEDGDAVERKISRQRENAKEKLAFLSDEKCLTFLGRLPYEGGKLTKIIVLSRNLSGKSLVEEVRGSLSMPKMPELATVESAATKVSRQSVKVKLEGHEVPRALRVPFCLVHFINETNFPMKIVSGTIGWRKTNLEFVQDVEPRSSYHRQLAFTSFGTFSAGGYIIIYLNGVASTDIEPPAGVTRVIEFALSRGSFLTFRKIHIQDKTCLEFTRGRDTYKAMSCGEGKTLYWCEREAHYMARADISFSFSLRTGLTSIWRFAIQDFDPLAVKD